jgi:hypothetical protein
MEGHYILYAVIAILLSVGIWQYYKIRALDVECDVKNKYLKTMFEELRTLQYEKEIKELPEGACPYHKKVHTEQFNHDSCITHGHCWQPIQCTQHKDCPTNANGINPLSWSSLS